jgi:hypothetical protein
MKKKLTRSLTNRDTVKCECGAEIVLLQDVKAMGLAIEVHIASHMQNAKDPANATGEAERIREALIAQVLSKASKSENDQAHQRGN